MDLNYFFQREQVERRLAMTAGSQQARAVHLELAEAYRGLIDRGTPQSLRTKLALRAGA